MSVEILVGDCREMLAGLPDQSAHTCVTSPPYFGLRDYGVEGQLGLEPSPDEFVEAIVEAFREVRRVLRDDGTVWLNLGDTYNNRRRIRSTSHQPSLNGFGESTWAEATANGLTRLSVSTWGMKEKDAMGIPWAVAFALRADGWFLRQEIIWRKNFGKPEPTRDRLPVRHEPIFLLSKSKSYHFDRAALPHWANCSVWEVPPIGCSGHGAAYPPDLIKPCILAGCPKGGTVLDPFGGAGTTGLVAQALGRNAILCELNSDYAAMARERIDGAIATPLQKKAIRAKRTASMVSYGQTVLF